MFGDALYAHLLPAEEIVAESAFLAAMVKLRQVCTNPDHHAIERLCFNVFSHHQECITKQGVCVCVRLCVCGLTPLTPQI